MLGRLLAEASLLGSSSVSEILNEVARQSSSVLSGGGELARALESGAPRLKGRLEELDALEPTERGRRLGDVGLALCARLSASWEIARAITPMAQPSRYYQTLLANRLCFLLPPTPFDPDLHLPMAAGVMGLDADPTLWSGLYRAVAASLEQVLEGEGGAAGDCLRELMGTRAPAGLALDPAIASGVIHSLSEYIGARGLKDAGLTKKQARSAQSGDGASSAAALYKVLGHSVRVWDLLSTVASLSMPIREGGGLYHCAEGTLEGKLPWALLGPRLRTDTTRLSLVSVRLEHARREAIRIAGELSEPSAMLAVESLWHGLVDKVEELGGIACQVQGDGLAVFSEAEEAEIFSRAVTTLIRPPLRLGLGGVREDLLLPATGLPEIQVLQGELWGAWNGESLWLRGPALAALYSGSPDHAGPITSAKPTPGMSLLTEKAEATDETLAEPWHLQDQQAPEEGALDTVDDFFLQPSGEATGEEETESGDGGSEPG